VVVGWVHEGGARFLPDRYDGGMDTEKSNGTKELWERLENEPERAYRAFESFLTLPSRERTLLGAYRVHVGNPLAAKPSDTWSRWSGEFAWRERAAAHDRHMDSIRREGVEEALKSEAKRHATLVERMRYETQEELTALHAGLTEYLDNLDWNQANIRMQDVIQIVKLKLDATMRFEEANPQREEPEGSGVDWSLDEKEFVDGVVAEILAEEEAEGLPDDEEGTGET
jgi:hypothetical protein